MIKKEKEETDRDVIEAVAMCFGAAVYRKGNKITLTNVLTSSRPLRCMIPSLAVVSTLGRYR